MDTVKPLVLASQSKYKIALFKKLAIPFETVAPDYVEDSSLAMPPADLAQTLATGKAHSLRTLFKQHVIIGADQVLALGKEVFCKPGTVDKAVAQLLKLSGQTHELHTAFTLLDSETGGQRSEVVTSQIRFHANLDPLFLRALVERDQTTDCVGAYKIESSGLMLMDSIKMEDPTAIEGLPLMRLASALSQWGYLLNRFRHEPV